MLTFGITVEGNYDAAVLTELIRKSLANNVEVISRICGSQSTLMRKFPSYLESFRHAKHGSHVDKALIIRDADNKNPHELVRVMQGRYIRFLETGSGKDVKDLHSFPTRRSSDRKSVV